MGNKWIKDNWNCKFTWLTFFNGFWDLFFNFLNSCFLRLVHYYFRKLENVCNAMSDYKAVKDEKLGKKRFKRVEFFANDIFPYFFQCLNPPHTLSVRSKNEKKLKKIQLLVDNRMWIHWKFLHLWKVRFSIFDSKFYSFMRSLDKCEPIIIHIERFFVIGFTVACDAMIEANEETLEKLIRQTKADTNVDKLKQTFCVKSTKCKDQCEWGRLWVGWEVEFFCYFFCADCKKSKLKKLRGELWMKDKWDRLTFDTQK